MALASLVNENLRRLWSKLDETTLALAETCLVSMQGTEESSAHSLCSLQVTALQLYRIWQCQQNEEQPQEPPIENDVDLLPVQPLRDQAIYSELEPNPRVFHHLFITSPDKEDWESPMDVLPALCAIAMYNIGLVMHIQSGATTMMEQKEQKKPNYTLLKEAEEYYLECLHLLNSVPLHMPSDGTLIMVYLATSNNLAEIYYASQDLVRAKAYQQTLGEIFWSVPAAPQSPCYRHFYRVTNAYGMPFPLSGNEKIHGARVFA